MVKLWIMDWYGEACDAPELVNVYATTAEAEQHIQQNQPEPNDAYAITTMAIVEPMHVVDANSAGEVIKIVGRGNDVIWDREIHHDAKPA